MIPEGSVRPAPRRWLHVSLVVLLGAVATIAGSLVTAPTFAEEARIGAVRHALRLVHAMAEFGPTTMVSASGLSVYESLGPHGTWPGLVSAWLTAALGSKGPDPLTALRFGWLFVTASAPAALFCIVLPARGVRAAWLSAGLLIAQPRWLHEAAVASETAVATSFGLWLVALYLGAVVPRGAARLAVGGRASPRLSALAFSVVLGLSAAANLAVLWVLPLLLCHFWVVHRRSVVRALRSGHLPAPPLLLAALAVTPAVVFATEPSLWRGGPARIAAWLFAPLSPTVLPEVYRGVAVTPSAPLPALYGPHWLLVTTPLLLLGFSIAGACLWALEAGRRGGAGPVPGRTRGIGFLVTLGVVGVLVSPLVMPSPLVRFPPRTGAVLPAIAVLAAYAADVLAVRVVGVARARLALGVGVVAALTACGAALPTAGAAFNLLGRLGRAPVSASAFRVGDGSELGILARSVDALGRRRVGVHSPEVPATYWKTLADLGRMATPVDRAGTESAAEFRVARGATPGALAHARYYGLPVWSLSRR